MKIYKPVQDSYTSQGFGENKAYVKVDKNGVPFSPFRVTGSPENAVPFYEALGMDGHNGEDEATYFKSPCFFPVMAECTWKAKEDFDFDGGIGLDVFSDTAIYIGRLPKQTGSQARAEWKKNKKHLYVKFRFWHAQSNIVKTGQAVSTSDRIQLCDSTGASSGHHLHWSMKFVNSRGRTLDKNNGYYGAVDFSRWYVDTFILDIFEKKPKLSTEQSLYRMAWFIRNVDKKTADILRSIARMVVAFETKVGGLLVKKK